MSKIDKLRDYLLENYVNEWGDLDLIGLDFSEFDGDILIGGMKVKGDLLQDYQKVQGDLFQGNQTVQGGLFQSRQKVQGNLHNRFSECGGILYEEPSTELLKEITTKEL